MITEGANMLVYDIFIHLPFARQHFFLPIPAVILCTLSLSISLYLDLFRNFAARNSTQKYERI